MTKRFPHVAMFLLSFASIALLLGHLYDLGSMSGLARTAGAASAIAMVALLVGPFHRDEEFWTCVRAGLVGGLLGTLGYDLVRIPLHYWGFNPFPPIRGYGVWITGSTASTPWTDLAGFLYHLSNGVTFGWMYAFVALRRNRWWAVGWGLVLETLAVVTAFGVVFGLRTAYGTVAIAYFAHLAYGWPLGWICERPERLRRFLPVHRRAWGAATVWIALVVALWFVTAWQPLSCAPAPGEILIGPEAMCPGWTDASRFTNLRLVNRDSQAIQLRHRRPGRFQTDGEAIDVPPGASVSLPLLEPGIHQLLAPGTDWRSVLVSVHEDGDYRPGSSTADTSSPDPAAPSTSGEPQSPQ